MKTKLPYLSVLFLLLFSWSSKAQTTLSPCDIAIMYAQADTPDAFAFVTFVDLAAGTTIIFTDCGADPTGGFRQDQNCTEGAVVFTSTGNTAGDIIFYEAGTSNPNWTSLSGDTKITGSFALSTTGDQVIAFQESGNAGTPTANAGNNPNFLFAFNLASTTFAGSPIDSNETGLPVGLTDTGLPRTAVGAGAGAGNDVEFDNSYYSAGIFDFSGYADIDAVKVVITDPASYTGNNTVQANGLPASIALPTLSTPSNSLKNGLRIYPNPSNDGRFVLANSEALQLQYAEVINVTGQRVKTIKLQETSPEKAIDLSSLNAGIYMMKITDQANNAVIKKLIIQ
jgi:hypothetical protein